jgi:hypothetical protein
MVIELKSFADFWLKPLYKVSRQLTSSGIDGKDIWLKLKRGQQNNGEIFRPIKRVFNRMDGLY